MGDGAKGKDGKQDGLVLIAQIKRGFWSFILTTSVCRQSKHTNQIDLCLLSTLNQIKVQTQTHNQSAAHTHTSIRINQSTINSQITPKETQQKGQNGKKE